MTIIHRSLYESLLYLSSITQLYNQSHQMVFNLCLPLILPLPVHQPAAATVAVPFLGCRLQWDEAEEVLPMSSCSSHPKRTRKLQLGLPTAKKVVQNRYIFFTGLPTLRYIHALLPFRAFTL